jgi:hypothetical protein
MLKNTGYQEKFVLLKPWIVDVIEVVKKDLRNEHLKIDRDFCKRYFLGKNPFNLTTEEMAHAYATDIEAGNVGLGEFIATRWLLKNADIYGFFEEILKKIDENFENLDVLSQSQTEGILSKALKQFGSTRTYLFSVLNSVVFPKEIYDELRVQAEQETRDNQRQEEQIESAQSLENIKKRHAREMAALKDRFEKKLNGMQKKYLHDVEKLKKQIQLLESRIAEHHGER